MLNRLLKRDTTPKSGIESLAEQIETELKDSISYKKSMKFIDTWKECDNFINGEQWPESTPATKDMPRPVLNMVQRINDAKTSAVLEQQPNIAFVANEGTPEEGVSQFDEQGADLFTQVAKENTWNNVKMEDMLEESCDVSANLGTSFKHWYWDQTIIGGSPDKGTVFIGDINGEVLGADKVHFGNPFQKNVQKQPKILIVGKIPYSEFKDAFQESASKLGVNIHEIKPDKDNSKLVTEDSKQSADDNYITVIHRYWKVFKGLKCFIYYAVVAGGKVVRYEEPLYEGELYPISAFRWYNRKDSAYGRGETEGAIPNQKQINRMLAIYLLSLYKVGMPKISYNSKYVKLSDININVPGGIIEDTSPSGVGSGWKYQQPAPMPGDIPNLLEQLMSMSKDALGANDAFLGESNPDNASAIAMLQKQASAPVEKIRKRLFRSIEEDMMIWALFYKNFYEEDRLIKISKNNQKGFAWFRGTDYYDLKLAVDVEANAGGALSEMMIANQLKELVAEGTITPDEKLEFTPKTMLPIKEQLMEARRKRLEQQAMQPQQPQDKLSVSINFKDLPPEGKIQAAKQAGIELSPEQIMQQEQMMQQPKEQPAEEDIVSQLPDDLKEAYMNGDEETKKQMMSVMMN